MTFGHTGEAHWAELNTASALGSLTAPAPKVKVKVKETEQSSVKLRQRLTTEDKVEIM